MGNNFWIGDKKKYSLDGQVRLIGAKLDVIKVDDDVVGWGGVELYMQASISEETDCEWNQLWCICLLSPLVLVCAGVSWLDEMRKPDTSETERVIF